MGQFSWSIKNKIKLKFNILIFFWGLFKKLFYFQNKHNTATNSNTNSNTNLELSFEYLMSKDKLQWITISSDQAILMSVCLQSMVDELLMKRNGLRKKSSILSRGSWSYMKRDGSSQLISLSEPDMHPTALVSDGIAVIYYKVTFAFSLKEERQSPTYQEESFSIKKLQEKFSTVSFKSGKEFIENHAFEGIGDDDL